MRAINAAAFALAICILPAIEAEAGKIKVPQHHETIGAAVDAASYGDTVVVAWGKYEESGIALKSGVVVQSYWVRPNRTAICGDKSGPLFLCDNVDGSAAVIGFCMCGGYNLMGGAVVNQNSCPTFQQCEFIGNTATMRGGAVHNQSSSPRFVSCVFRENVAGLGGGAVSNVDGSSPYFEDCVFFSNFSGGEGSAVTARDGCSPKFVDCAVLGNLVDSAGSIYARNDSHVEMTHCTIVGNDMFGRGPTSGLMVGVNSSAEVSKCLFAHNKGQSVHCWPHGLIQMSCCNLWGCFAPDCWLGSCVDGQKQKRGNISVDPLLVDPESCDIRMSPRSPCYADSNSCGVFIGCRSFAFSEVVADEPDMMNLIERFREVLDRRGYRRRPAMQLGPVE